MFLLVTSCVDAQLLAQFQQEKPQLDHKLILEVYLKGYKT